MTVTQDDQFIEGPAAKKVVYVLQQPEPAAGHDEIDVEQLAGVLWRRKWWIAGWTGLLTALAVVYVLAATEWYRAEAVLMPRDSRSGSGLAGQLTQFGGLADLAGLSLGQNSKQEPLGVLRSTGFARRFIEKNGLIATLADEKSMRVPGGGQPEQGLGEVAHQFVRSVMTVSEDRRTGLVTVAVEWKDASTAADWANKITRQVNDEMRLRALDEGTRNVSYLQEQLAVTDAVSLQQAIARLLEVEMQKVMLAQGTDEYAFRIIDSAEPPVKRSRPKRTMTVLFAFAAALFLSTLGAILTDPIRRLVRSARSP